MLQHGKATLSGMTEVEEERSMAAARNTLEVIREKEE